MRFDKNADWNPRSGKLWLVGLAKPRPESKREQRERHAETISLLRESSLFDGVADSDLEGLTGHVWPAHFPQNWVVIRQGEVIERCVLVLEGELLETSHGDVSTVHGPGSVVGLADALAGRRAPTAVVSGDSFRGISIDAQVLSNLRLPAYGAHKVASTQGRAGARSPQGLNPQGSF